MNFFKEAIRDKPKFVIILSIIFFIMSALSSLIGFEIYFDEDKLLKNEFLNNELMFYLLFIAVNGLTFFFFFLAKELWKLKEWSRYFMLGSSFVSLIYSIYNIIILIYAINKNNHNLNALIERLLLNIIYILIYILLLKYFTSSKIVQFFNR